MSKNLVIVESPAKARTIEKYLGRDFAVLASYGHVRDLVPKDGAVDPEHGFAMKYGLIEKNKRHVETIARAVRKADAVFLATDPDREGEAISWHIYEVLKERKLLDSKPVNRVVFNEVTKRAIQEAIRSPRQLSTQLVNAQQARRALDYLVGFNLSPLLWKKVRRGLSAGRVQSPALRLIVEREDEINAFVPREYWTIEAVAALKPVDGHEPRQFNARLSVFEGTRVEQFTFTDEAGVRAAESAIDAAAAPADASAVTDARGVLTCAKVDRKQRRRNPEPPFITSTLQQDASRKLGFSAQKTMSVAQRLYEGVDTGEGSIGLITYMRTDSVTLAAEAVSELRRVIAERYGAESLPDSPRQYRTKARNAQEAHEAIRPTAAARTPAAVRKYLDRDQFRLYELIWKRTVACQMIPALFNTVGLDLAAGPSPSSNIVFRATGSVLVNPGYLSVYREGRDDSVHEERDRILPPVEEGDRLILKDVASEQHFTEPPPRYSEATLVKALEEFGIGRPSTYASIISTLRNREYVEMESRRFVPTDVGRLVNRFLTEFFAQYVDYQFTAKMEDSLDAVSRGETEWVPLLDEFWRPFHELVEKTESSVTREQVAKPRVLGDDPKSGRPLSVRMGRYGPFVQVGTRDDPEKPLFASLLPGQKMDRITFEEALELVEQTLAGPLGVDPASGRPVSVRMGRYGPFVQVGTRDDPEKPLFASLRSGQNMSEVTLEVALELIEAKRAADANRVIQDFGEAGIQVLKGRYGPYVTNGSKNARIPKDADPGALSLEECRALLAAAPARGARGKPAAGKKTATSATGARAAGSKKPARRSAAAKAGRSAKTAKRPAKKNANRKRGGTTRAPGDDNA